MSAYVPWLIALVGGMALISHELRKIKEMLDVLRKMIADIRSMLERMDWDPTQSAPVPSASRSEPPDAQGMRE
jgi:hypothetical protein